MIYDSIDNIPLKLYYKIEVSKNYSLLSDKVIDVVKAKNIFLSIKKEYEKLVPPKKNRSLTSVSNINEYDCKKRACLLAVAVLRKGYNAKMANILKSNDFQVNENTLQKDLDTIELEIEGLDFLIEDIVKQLKLKKQDKKITFDTYYAYATKILGVLLDANKLTLSQHISYTEVVNKELETRKKQWQKDKLQASK